MSISVALAETRGRLVSAIREVWSEPLGRVGLVLLVAVVVVSVYAIAVLPPDFPDLWNTPQAWEILPSLAPPAWIKLFGVPVAPHASKVFTKPSSEGLTMISYVQNFTLIYNLREKAFPNSRGIVVVVEKYEPAHATRRGRSISIDAYARVIVERPDGISVVVYTSSTPIIEGMIIRIDPALAARQLIPELNRVYGVNYTFTKDLARVQNAIVQYLFGKPKPDGSVEPLTGKYRITVSVSYQAPGLSPRQVLDALVAEDAGVKQLRVVVAGSAYGVLGTDLTGHDLWLGILYGFPVALAEGLLVALAVVAIGVVAGVVSGYYGGWVDELIQRFVDLIGNIPWLPILVLIGVIAQEIYTNPWHRLLAIMTALALLSWGNTAIMVRSMTLSIKAEPYVEAAKAIGASSRRIIFYYIVPQILPYTMANLVFTVPAAIITEASLSILGIEHGLPTWGRILEDAHAALRYDVWWWIIPPGALIALTSMAFVLLGMAIEVIIDPRLKPSK